MARPARPWFRFYVEAMRDPKMRRLTPTQRWLWVAILAAVRESYLPPFLMVAEGVPYSWGDLADYAGVKVKDVELGTDLMHDLGMLAYDKDFGAWFLPKWNERQYESDDVTKRVKRFRERHSNVSETAVETPPETDTETETETPPTPRDDGIIDPAFEALLEEVVTLYAGKVTARRTNLTNKERFKASVVTKARQEHRDQIHRWANRYNVSVDQLASALIDGVPSSWNSYLRPSLKVVSA